MITSSQNTAPPVVVRYFTESFERGIRGAVEIGGLLALRWHISKAESNQSSKLRPALYEAAKAIERRWTSLEEEHGEGALLVEESWIIQQCISDKNPASRHFQNPDLIDNARKLRMTKGQEWWDREHCLDVLAEVAQSDSSGQADVLFGQCC